MTDLEENDDEELKRIRNIINLNIDLKRNTQYFTKEIQKKKMLS